MPGLTRAGRVAALTALVGALIAGSAMAQTMIVGNDEKVGRDENGKSVQREPGHDTLSVVDISKPEAPVVVGHDPAAEHDLRPAGQSGDPSLRASSPWSPTR